MFKRILTAAIALAAMISFNTTNASAAGEELVNGNLLVRADHLIAKLKQQELKEHDAAYVAQSKFGCKIGTSALWGEFESDATSGLICMDLYHAKGDKSDYVDAEIVTSYYNALDDDFEFYPTAIDPALVSYKQGVLTVAKFLSTPVTKGYVFNDDANHHWSDNYAGGNGKDSYEYVAATSNGVVHRNIPDGNTVEYIQVTDGGDHFHGKIVGKGGGQG